MLTNISPAQLQYFGTVEHLAAELGMLLSALPKGGTAIINGEDELIRTLIPQCIAPISSFMPSTVQNPKVTWSGIRCTLPEDSNIYLSSFLMGAHNFSTLLAAYTIGKHLGLKPAEMQFVNNRFILHSRTGFEDYPEPERRRHLIRMWLKFHGSTRTM